MHWDWWSVGQLIHWMAHFTACLSHAWSLARTYRCERSSWFVAMHITEVLAVHFVFVTVRALEMSMWNPVCHASGAINLLRSICCCLKLFNTRLIILREGLAVPCLDEKNFSASYGPLIQLECTVV